MRFELTCEDFTVTEAIHQFVNDQLESLNKHVPQAVSMEVFLKKEGPRDYHAILITKVAHQEIMAESRAEDIYKAIRSAKKNMERRVHDLFGKFAARRHA